MAALTDPLEALRRARRADILPSGPLAVACSGGVDSMALVEALLAHDRRPTVLTVDHGLHPESDQHARFVADAWSARGLDVEVLRADPERVRAGEGPEDGARRERYRLLEAAAARCGARAVLTAHTADDQAETLLMRIAMGAGTRGLAGIPARRGPFARPWLDVPRAAVLAFARERGVDWREDPSNATARFLRNRVRQQVVPAMEALFGEGWVEVAARSAAHVRGDVEAQSFLLERWREEAVQPQRDGVSLSTSALEGAPPGLRRLVLRDAIEDAARLAGVDPVRDLAVHVEQLDRLVREGGSGRCLDLPGALEARYAYGRLVIARAEATPSPARCGATLRIEGPGEYTWRGWVFEVDRVRGLPPEGQRGAGCLATHAAPMPWIVRAARVGERFRPYGAPGSKRVSRLWIDARVDRRERAELPVVESGERLVWVGGLRIAHAARVKGEEPAWRLRARRVDDPSGSTSEAR